jgi:hypothetical protein
MANDVFGRTSPTLNGVFAADLAVVTFGSAALTTTLMQSLQLSYAQQVSQFFELGANATYLIGGRASGQLGVGHIVGPGATILAWYNQFGDVCKADQNVLNFTAKGSECSKGASQALNYSIKYIVLTQVGLSVQAQDVVISENSSARFTALEVTAG